MHPSGHFQCTDGLMVTKGHGHIIYSYTLLVPLNQRAVNNSSKGRGDS